MEDDLIHEVRKHQCIYDKKCVLYRNRKSRVKAWRSISDALGTSSIACQTRWKSLRDRYIREVSKLEECAKNDTGFVSNWAFFQKMDFLRKIVKPRTVAISENQLRNSMTPDEQQEVDSELLENSFDETMSPSSSRSEFHDPLSSSSLPLNPSNSELLRKRRFSEEFSCFLKDMREIASKRFCPPPAPTQYENHHGFFSMCNDLFKKLPCNEVDDAKIFILNHLHQRIQKLRRRKV